MLDAFIKQNRVERQTNQHQEARVSVYIGTLTLILILKAKNQSSGN